MEATRLNTTEMEIEIKEDKELVVGDDYNKFEPKQRSIKPQSEFMLWATWTLWFIFGGGLIMTIMWCLVATIATLLLIPGKSSMRVFTLLPIVTGPHTVYSDYTIMNTTCCYKTSRFFWILPFGFLLSTIHLVFAILFLPLSCCGVSWSEYHKHAMYVIFNPIDKFVIDRKKEPFTWHSTSTQVVADVPMEGKVVIVTGCNTGIGKDTAKVLYQKGCIVIMACRNPKKANNARNDIIEECPDKNPDNLIFIRLDLGDLKTINEFVAEYEKNEIINGRLDILIENAGVMSFPKFGATTDGFERQFGINHMGHFYLINQLLPIIKANKTRIVATSSGGHYMFHTLEDMTSWLNINDNGYKGPTEDVVVYDQGGSRYYGISKLANILMIRQINKLYNKDGIYALSCHPGGIAGTELTKHMAVDCDFVKNSCRLWLLWESGKMKSIPQGAATQLRCATITDEEIIAGDDNGEQLLYFDDCMSRNDKMHPSFIHGQNTEVDQLLWNYSREAVKALELPLNED